VVNGKGLGKFNPVKLTEFIFQHQGTLIALVPAHVLDIVKFKLQAPKSLRAAIIGGGALSQELYEASALLGWNLFPSFGMTECCSQVATASVGDPSMQLLPHVQTKVDENHRLFLKSEALLSGYVHKQKLIDPKVDGWFATDDRVEIIDHKLRFMGRLSDVVKIGGESVDLVRLQKIIDLVRGEREAIVIAYPDTRLGSVIHLAVDKPFNQKEIESFNEQVMPFEKIRQVHLLKEMPRNALGKISQQNIVKHLLSST
jgi:O-succinylbenzoic acid--CoA ligase